MSATRIAWATHTANPAGGCSEPRLSGKPGAPMDLAWVRALRDQCAAAGVPFFLKQSAIDGRVVELPELDGRTWDQLPQLEIGR